MAFRPVHLDTISVPKTVKDLAKSYRDAKQGKGTADRLVWRSASLIPSGGFALLLTAVALLSAFVPERATGEIAPLWLVLIIFSFTVPFWLATGWFAKSCWWHRNPGNRIPKEQKVLDDPLAEQAAALVDRLEQHNEDVEEWNDYVNSLSVGLPIVRAATDRTIYEERHAAGKQIRHDGLWIEQVFKMRGRSRSTPELSHIDEARLDEMSRRSTDRLRAELEVDGCLRTPAPFTPTSTSNEKPRVATAGKTRIPHTQ